MLKKIIATAKEAGEAILEFYDDEIEDMHKEVVSPLTKAELAVHHIIIDALQEIDPATIVISEESVILDYESRRDWSKFWIVDPLDGTKEVIKKNGEFNVNIALIEDGNQVRGVAYVPEQDRMS